MTDSQSRPDPDLLLRRVQAEEDRARRGRLRIFFGFAPGVGKTFRMLQVARELISDSGVDLVVGVVETHRRAETMELLDGLESLPRRNVEYRGHEFTEFDLDAALARNPSVLLVDELAHTNAPGSRHPKRWQDVIELCDAGIDVFTTVNVQHVESLNDVIAQITHVKVRETIPDSILDRADEIEIVDITPEELLERLREGKVYFPEQAERAAEHFFRRGNLLALRELALRRTAQHVDEDVLEYRAEHGVVSTWPAGERVLVCVGPAPSSARLIRAACRMAAGFKAPWIAACVETPAVGTLSEADRLRLDSHLRLAESLGGQVTRLRGLRVSEALLAYARKHNVTRIIIGKPTHSRLLDRLRGSLLDEVVRGSGDIDIQVITGDAPEPQAERPRLAAPKRRALGPYLLSGILVGATTTFALGVRHLFPIPDLEVLFFLTIMGTAVWLGRGPAIFAASLAVAAYDFFFVPPFFTFGVADGRYLLTFIMMFGVGMVIGGMGSRIRRQEQDAVAREERTAQLYSLSRDLSAAEDASAAALALARHAAELFAAKAWVLREKSSGLLDVVARHPESAELDGKERGVAKWAHENGALAGLGTDTLPGSSTLSAPIRAGDTALGVLAIAPPRGSAFGIEQLEVIDALCRQAALAFERARLVEEARGAELRRRSEELRGTLLSAVSHDLRTPLAAITGAATSLRDDTSLSPEAKADLLVAVCEEAERLERLVANLLDMTRIESGAMLLHREWVPVDELVGSALSRLDKELTGREVHVELAEALPLLQVDPVLLPQVLVNLLENAAKYTPPGTPIDVLGAVHGDSVTLDVADRGPGIPPGVEHKLFDKFYRGTHVGVRGIGLGLAICRWIAEAHQGKIEASNRPGGGALFRVTLPVGTGAPTLDEEPQP